MTKLNCGVRNLVVECQFHNFKVQNSFPKRGCELRDFIGPKFRASTGVVPRKQNRER